MYPPFRDCPELFTRSELRSWPAAAWPSDVVTLRQSAELPPTGYRCGGGELVLACELMAWMQMLAPHGHPARR
jgi:hypothetical protein